MIDNLFFSVSDTFSSPQHLFLISCSSTKALGQPSDRNSARLMFRHRFGVLDVKPHRV